MIIEFTSLVKLLSRVRLFAIPWTVAYQAPPSMEFSRQEYWSGLPFPAPGDLPNPRIEPGSPTSEADTLSSEPPGKPESTSRAAVIHELTHVSDFEQRQAARNAEVRVNN